MIKITNTFELSGTIIRKVDNVARLSFSVNPSVTYTEFTDIQLEVAASGEETISYGGLAYPKMVYVETDNAVTFKAFRGASVVASTLPIDSALLLTVPAANRFGTVTISNAGVSDADVKIYLAG